MYRVYFTFSSQNRLVKHNHLLYTIFQCLEKNILLQKTVNKEHLVLNSWRTADLFQKSVVKEKCWSSVEGWIHYLVRWCYFTPGKRLIHAQGLVLMIRIKTNWTLNRMLWTVNPVTSHLVTFEYTNKANSWKFVVVNGESNHKPSNNVQSKDKVRDNQSQFLW